MLLEINDIYRRLNAFLPISARFDELMRSIAANLYRRDDDDYLDRLSQNIMELAVDQTSPLRVMRIEYASPGFIELLGTLNVVKTITVFISTWRHENTERKRVESGERVEIAKIESAERISLAGMFRERTDELSRERGFVILEKYAHRMLAESERQLIDIAKDARVTEVLGRLPEG